MAHPVTLQSEMEGLVAIGSRWPAARELGLRLGWSLDPSTFDERFVVRSATYGGDLVASISRMEAEGLMWRGRAGLVRWLERAIEDYTTPILIMRRAQVGG